MSLFTSKRSEFNSKNRAFVDMVQAHMSQDIEVSIKTNAGTPVKTGNMKSQVRHFKNGNGNWRVEANAAYSAYQERGARADGTHRVTHYTTAGTSAGWFKRAIDRVVKQRDSYVKEAARAVGL